MAADPKPDVVQWDFVPLPPEAWAPGQKLMVEDGLPPALVVPQEARDASWRGKRVRSIAGFAPAKPKPSADEGTLKLLAEIAARDKAQRREAKREAKERALIRSRQKAPKETDMAQPGPKELQVKTLRETRAKATQQAPDTRAPQQKETDMKTGTGKQKTKKGGPKKAAAKKVPPTTRRQKGSPAASAARQVAPKTEGGVRLGSKLETIVGLLRRPEGCTTAQVLEATAWPSVSMPQQAKAAGIELYKEKVDGRTIYRDAATVKGA